MNKYSTYYDEMGVQYYSEGSKYLNKEVLNGVKRMANWFTESFLNNGIRQHMKSILYANSNSGIPEMYKYEKLIDILPPNMLRRIEAAADFLYDESCFCLRREDRNANKNRGFASQEEEEVYEKQDHDRNILISKCILAMQLATWYAQPLTKFANDAQCDDYMEHIYYKIICHYKAGDVFDLIIKEANRKHFDTYVKKFVDKDTVVDIYEWDPNRAYSLFSVLLGRVLHNIYGYNMVEMLSTTLAHRIDRVDFNLQRYNPKNIAYDIIKRAVVDINKLNCDLTTKNRLMNAMSKIMDDVYFDEIKEEELMRAVFTYAENRRPTMKCQKLFDEKYEEYKYEGVVYHGFRSYTNWGFRDPGMLLKEYHDGFISCSKDISIAAEFSGMFDDFDDYEIEARAKNKACGSYVIEILIDENVQAIDAEKLLKDIHGNYPERYLNMFQSYEREREVLLKLPMVSFNILTIEEVMERINQESKDKKKWDDFRKIRRPAKVYTDASDPSYESIKKKPEVVTNEDIKKENDEKKKNMRIVEKN